MGGVSAPAGGGSDDRDRAERSSRMRLTQLAEPGDEHLGALVQQTSAASVVARIEAGDRAVRGLDHYRSRLSLDPDDPIALLSEVDGRFVVPGDGEWPTQLAALGAGAPLGLYVVGADLRVAAVRSVAVVGSRAATEYGASVASELATDLALRGWTVVSGGAYGIDAAVHRGALVAGGSTVAVLACGVDTVYPRGHVELFERVVGDGGVLVAELPPGATPTKPRFLKRNRVIAGLTRGTVVVEAQLRSGALNTAAHARRIGRPVMVVPGPVSSANSAGCHRLARDDDPARLVTDASEVVEEVGLIGELSDRPEPAALVRDALDPTVQRVLEALPGDGPVDLGSLSVAAGLEPGTVDAALRHLLEAGLVRQTANGFARVPGAADLAAHRRGGLPRAR